MADTMPDWRAGDLLAITQDRMPAGHSVAYGCHVFVANRDPHTNETAGPGWRYGYAPCSQFRKATANDLDRLISIHADELHRTIDRLKQLTDWRKQFFPK